MIREWWHQKNCPQQKRRLDIKKYTNLYIHTLCKHMQKIVYNQITFYLSSLTSKESE